MTTFLFAYLVFLVEILDTNNDTINNMGNFLIKKKSSFLLSASHFGLLSFLSDPTHPSQTTEDEHAGSAQFPSFTFPLLPPISAY